MRGWILNDGECRPRIAVRKVTLRGRAAYELELNKSSSCSSSRLDHEAEIGLAFRDNTAKGIIDRGFVER